MADRDRPGGLPGGGAVSDRTDRARHLRTCRSTVGGSHILQGVDLRRRRRSGVTALLGRNGVGKTTTLKAVLGLVPRAGRSTAGSRSTGRAVARQPHPPAGPAGPRLRAGGPRRLRRPHRGGEPAAGRAAPAAAPTTTRSYALFPNWRSGPGSGPARCPAASSRWWRSAGCCSTPTGCCWSTSRRRAWRPKVVTEVADVLERVAADGAGAAGRAEPGRGPPAGRRRGGARRRPGRVTGRAADLLADAGATHALLGRRPVPTRSEPARDERTGAVAADR